MPEANRGLLYSNTPEQSIHNGPSTVGHASMLFVRYYL